VRPRSGIDDKAGTVWNLIGFAGLASVGLNQLPATARPLCDPGPVDGGEPLRGVAGVLPDGGQLIEDPSGSGA